MHAMPMRKVPNAVPGDLDSVVDGGSEVRHGIFKVVVADLHKNGRAEGSCRGKVVLAACTGRIMHMCGPCQHTMRGGRARTSDSKM